MSTTVTEFDVRLTTVENALSEIQEKLGLGSSKANWVDQIAGSLADIPEDEYQKYLACCRAIREEGHRGELP